MHLQAIGERPAAQRGQVKALPGHGSQVGRRVKIASGDPDHLLDPELERKFLPIFGIDFLPALHFGRFGIHDQTVKIKNKRFYHKPSGDGTGPLYPYLSSIPGNSQ